MSGVRQKAPDEKPSSPSASGHRSGVRTHFSIGQSGGRKAPWIALTALGLVLVAGGVGLDFALAASIRARVGEVLQLIQHNRVTGLEVWARERLRLAATLVASGRARGLITAALTGPDPAARLAAAQDLEREAAPVVSRYKQLGFVFLDAKGDGFSIHEGQVQPVRIALAKLIGVGEAFEGREALSPPFPLDAQTSALGGTTAQFAWVPVTGARGEVECAFGLRVNPETTFAQLLTSAEKNEKGSTESYAFDQKGTLLTASRFDEELQHIGLLKPGEASPLHVSLRDPGGNLLEGYKPDGPREALPLTKMARSGVAKLSGMDLEGYRSYRGVPVVGAWNWLPALEMGVATEIDLADAYATLQPIRWGLRGLLFCLVLAALFALFYVARTRNLEQTVEEAAQLGRYKLGKRLGKGGMGEVYEAEHGLLARRAAIKLFKGDAERPEMKERFEREARSTARLVHPNTIAVFDFGTTPEGMFYYAMEYVEGVNLDNLVAVHGPLPVGRAVHILLQLTGSIAEAHEVGLLHRDIKPANVMLSLRAGIPDFVKVLDFGLVRTVADSTVKLTGEHEILGTPAYMPPESMTRTKPLDHRVDIYAIGAVAYYLLTGKDAFVGEGIAEIITNRLVGKYIRLQQHDPNLPEDLCELIHSCLSEEPNGRPAGARVLMEQLERIQARYPYHSREALAWWRQNARSEKVQHADAPSIVSAETVVK